MIKAVQYLPISREVEVLLTDNSRHAWQVDNLEMVANVDGEVVPLSMPTREQLIDVIPYGGGAYIYWPQIEQMFELEALLDGVYGRESWMKKLNSAVTA
ncbi:hypothetical protein [cf. Phormidesmis sp. LEGE 11477]|uniref:hypothetical protein n=1 Tax=cf. Phormidesmis sp. LEGE 11477 TaxID=1828680 RepID=UPI0018801927|nr:hypothetical protein [cf. Phormidesmis sp. LEGE 11477]MBE9061585.1 hypothetical protein [cf. Phormidesmis sp. LEGE 11477]